jgi:parallel beta-helix repeat protein
MAFCVYLNSIFLNPLHPSCTTARGLFADRLGLIAVAAFALAAASGCSSDPAGPMTPVLPEGCTAAVDPSADDQTAVQTALIEAAEGSTVCLMKGTFTFASELSLTVNNVTIRGAGQDATVLEFKDQTVGGNGLLITSDGVTVESLTVQNTPGDGIRANDVSDIHFKNVTVRWDEASSLKNGAYGLYPVGSEGVRIEGCVVSGARDAGIYVGQSKNILVAESEAFGNVAGIEIENSSDAEVRGNKAHDNTGGILVFNLPNLPVQDGRRSNVHDNIIENNNLENFAAPGTTVSTVPRGSGLMILSSDENEFHKNMITGNVSVGILVLSYSDLIGKPNDPDFDIYPQGNWFHDNTFSGNGTMSADAVKLLIPLDPVPDIVWDGCEDPDAVNMNNALTNCASNNGSATFYNMDYCKTAGGPSQDISKVTCEHAALPTQNP